MTYIVLVGRQALLNQSINLLIVSVVFLLADCHGVIRIITDQHYYTVAAHLST